MADRFHPGVPLARYLKDAALYGVHTSRRERILSATDIRSATLICKDGRQARKGAIPGQKRPPHICHCGGGAWVPLTQGYVAIIDPEDVPAVATRTWYAALQPAGAGHYVQARSKSGGRVIGLGPFLCGERSDAVVDHRSGDEMDFRRDNLRVCSVAQNVRNRAKRAKGRWPYKGISYHARQVNQPWRASLTFEGRAHWSPGYPTQEEAARAYDDLARKHHGEFARLNFPDA